MKIIVDEKGCEKNNITMAEMFYLLALHYELNDKEAQKNLESNGYIFTCDNGKLFKKYYIANSGIQLINSCIADSEITDDEEIRIINLAKALKELFPKGKKPGTNYYWAEGTVLITRRLKLFFKKYGNHYTNDQIINATKAYLESFNGDYMYMKLLKYFIFKEKLGAAGDIEGESELLNYIENANQVDELKNDWVSTLV